MVQQIRHSPTLRTLKNYLNWYYDTQFSLQIEDYTQIIKLLNKLLGNSTLLTPCLIQGCIPSKPESIMPAKCLA